MFGFLAVAFAFQFQLVFLLLNSASLYLERVRYDNFLTTKLKNHLYCIIGFFSVIPPVEAVAAATSVFTEYLCESVDSAHNSQMSQSMCS